MKAKNQNDMVDWDDHLDQQYDQKATPTREQYEEEFETFKISTLIKSESKEATKSHTRRTCFACRYD